MNQTAKVLGVIAIIVLLGGVGYYALNTGETAGPGVVANVPPGNTGDQNPGTTPPSGGSAPVATTNALVAPTDTTVVVTGTVIPKGALTTYWYEYGATTALVLKTSIQTVGSGFSAIPSPAYITGLTKDTTYYYRVMAQNQFGTAAGDQHSFVTTHGTPAPVGSAPTTKTASPSNVSRTTATLNGEVTPNKATTQYWFEYGTTMNLGAVTAFTAVGNGTAGVLAAQPVSNLAPGTTYFYRVNAQNQFGTNVGAILSFKTAGPIASKEPAVNTNNPTSVTSSTATLLGTVNPNGTDTSYWFEYSTNSLLSALLLKTTPSQTVTGSSGLTPVTANLSNLNSKTTYYVKLVAQNSAGITYGDRVSFKTK